MGDSAAFAFGKTVLTFLATIGIAIWIGIIWKAEGEDKLVEACYPIEWSTDSLHDVTTALIGKEPVWTLKLQRYLMGGCYYFFSIMLRSGDDNPNSGGVRR